MAPDNLGDPRRSRRLESGEENRALPRQPINFLATRPSQKETRPHTRRVLLLVLLFVLAAAVAGLARAKFLSDRSDNPVDYDPITLEPKKPEGFFRKITTIVFGQEPTLIGEKDDRINILLTGMGGPGHDGPYLTDTIILASVKPSTKQVAMISIPRDLGVEIPDYGWYKINHANAFGEAKNPGRGGELTVRVVEKTFAVDIPYYVRVDFKAFEELVNLVDGIHVDVERSFVDTQYPAPKEQFQTISFEKGVQRMGGERALEYARSRHGNNNEGSDFARAKRQQKVLLALKEKLLSYQTLLNPIRINGILKSLEAHMTTNLSFSDMISLLKLAKDLGDVRLTTIVLDTSEQGYLEQGYTEDGAYVLLPKTGNFSEIQTLVENIFTAIEGSRDTTPPQAAPPVSPANVELQNGTWRAGLAARAKQRLRHQGVNISSIGNTTVRPIPESGIYQISETAPGDTLAALKNELQLPIRQAMPPGEQAASTTDILVILGEDFTE